MFRAAANPKVPRAKPQLGDIIPVKLPFRGLNARDVLSNMGPEFAISLKNMVVDPYGIRMRKGYVEYAKNLPGNGEVSTLLSYYPAASAPQAPNASGPFGKLFAAKGGNLYDITGGGSGTWTAQANVSGSTDFWNSTNIQNVAGAYLCACNEGGGYAHYNGTVWATPTQGASAGQINNVNPASFAFVTTWKKRLWFIEKGTTKAWYLPVDQITGAATKFDFGYQFQRGGQLQWLGGWTVDGGEGVDDYLVAVSSQGDVVIYKGVDPDTASSFNLHGVWNVGPLPYGRRCVFADSGDVYILSQLGVMPVSKLLAQKDTATADSTQHISFNVDPIIAALMSNYSHLPGWQIVKAAREEMLLVGIPLNSGTDYSGSYLAYKLLTKTWSLLIDTGYAALINVENTLFSGTRDGRVVRAFEGQLDNVLIGASSGVPVKGQVIPAYQPLGKEGITKHVTMVRPSLLTAEIPVITMQLLTDYANPKLPLYPALPQSFGSKWDSALWNVAVWGGAFVPIHRWFGCPGVGFVATVQLDFTAGGDTLLTSIDYWAEAGGVM